MMARHGTRSCYEHNRCRCDACREAHRVDSIRMRAARRAATAANGGIAPIDPHGSRYTYRNWYCRCDACRAANARHSAENRQKARQRKAVASS